MKKGEEARLAYTTRKQPFREEPPTPAHQQLYVQRRRVAGGKWVVEVTGFEGHASDLEQLAGRLKAACAVGGSAKEGIIYLQGDCLEKVMAFLKKEGHTVKKKGG